MPRNLRPRKFSDFCLHWNVFENSCWNFAHREGKIGILQNTACKLLQRGRAASNAHSTKKSQGNGRIIRFLGCKQLTKKKLETIYVCECVCLSLLQFEQTHFESHRTVWLYFSSNIARIREFWTKSSGGLKCHGSLMPGLIYRFELRGEGWCAKAKGFLCRSRVRHLFES